MVCVRQVESTSYLEVALMAPDTGPPSPTAANAPAPVRWIAAPAVVAGLALLLSLTSPLLAHPGPEPHPPDQPGPAVDDEAGTSPVGAQASTSAVSGAPVTAVAGAEATTSEVDRTDEPSGATPMAVDPDVADDGPSLPVAVAEPGDRAGIGPLDPAAGEATDPGTDEDGAEATVDGDDDPPAEDGPADASSAGDDTGSTGTGGDIESNDGDTGTDSTDGDTNTGTDGESADDDTGSTDDDTNTGTDGDTGATSTGSDAGVGLGTARTGPGTAEVPERAPIVDPDRIPEIVFPVVGPVWYTDTWGACRGPGCSRSHEGVDIFGHKLAPLVAATDGTIVAERRSGLGLGGNLVIIQDDFGWRYIYVHLNNDAPGGDDGSNPQSWIMANRLRVGDRVAAGQVIGYLGDSGNAENTPAHVHFEISRPGVGEINPTPFVEAAEEEGRVVTVASLASTAEGRAAHAPVVDAWYRALLGREPSRMERFAWTDRFDIGFATADDLIADLTMAKQRRDPAGIVVRSFHVSLGRRPTINELRQWEQQVRSGVGLEEITQALISSRPFADRHGTLSDEAFIDVVYRNALGRGPSEARKGDWLSLFDSGVTRNALTTHLADSYAVKDATWHDLEVIQAFRAALDRMPDDDEFERWVTHLDRDGLIPDVVAGIRAEG